MVVISSWPKLMVSGKSAEQPRPASAKARTPSQGSPVGRSAVATSAAALTNGRHRYTRRGGNHRSMAANSTRPAVTIPQKMVSASEATAALDPRCRVM